MSKNKKILFTTLVSVALLLLFIIAILPQIVRSQAVAAIEEATGRKARIESVSINPFTLTITVQGCAINAADGGGFISIGTVRASLGLASIFRRALILSEVSIDAPAVSFARQGANSYSFNDITERLKSRPKKESKGELHFSINNISVTNGSLDFDDRAVEGGSKHTIHDLKIAVPFISNIPYLVEKYTDPHISAIVDGAPFTFNGKVKPLSKSMETSVHINLKQLSLPEYIVYLPSKPPADLVSGNLNVDCEVTYRISADKIPELGIKGQLGLDTVGVNVRGGQPLLRLPSLQVKASDLEVFTRKFLFDGITVEGLELFVSRNAAGEWMYRQLMPASTENAKPAPGGVTPPKKSSLTLQQLVQVKTFTFSNGIVHFADAQPTGGFKSSISRIDAAVHNFSTTANSSADYQLSLLLDNEATFSADGSFSLAPLTVTVSSELNGVKIQRAWPYLSRFLTAPVKGTVDLSAEIAFNNESGLTVKQGNMLINGLSARYGDKEGFDLARFEVANAWFRQKDNSIDVGAVTLSKGDVSLSRQADGKISLLTLLKPPPEKPGSTAVTQDQPVKKAKQELSYRVKKLQIEKFNTTFTDKTVQDKPTFTLKNSSLSLSNLNGPKFTPAALRFTSTFDKSTPLAVTGDITPMPFRYKGKVSVGRLPLRDFEAYFPSDVKVFILGGFADTAMDVDIALKEGKAVGSFKGSSGIRAFHAVDMMDEEDLLKWESLQFDDIQGNLEPFSLSLRQIALNGVYSRIIVRKDGTLNLQNLVQKEGRKPESGASADSVSKAVVPSAAPVVPQPVVPRKQINVGALTIQDGTISFTDKHLPQQFATTFHNLGGRVSGLSSEDSRMADVDLRGNLENLSPLQINGQINPLRDDLFVDLKVSFRDIELSPVTPYSSRFLGYTVEKGKLFLDLKYHIDKKQLVSENKIFIDQFTFGEKVESDKATSLPVKLGLALLKDRKGEIHLDVPVTGHTDDPQFNVWKLVFQVVQNLLVKAVTSPFALLSSMVGGGEDFSAIQFNYGSSTLSPREEQKLHALSKALLDRPALKVEFKGYVDREKDTEEYRRELLNGKLRNEKFLAVIKTGMRKDGETAESMTVMPEEQALYMSAVYKKEKFPKPRNAFGLVKELPPEEMRKLIITNTAVGESELQELAHERVKSIVNYMVKKGGVPAERMFQKFDDVFKKPERESALRSRVELNAIVQ
ncbi:MAG: DUF748 domain-containing protein [Desulfuromonadaceae bacterium]|nr:DUF748 domain-containing protein [Desulfuromonadaceae bacterium]